MTPEQKAVRKVKAKNRAKARKRKKAAELEASKTEKIPVAPKRGKRKRKRPIRNPIDFTDHDCEKVDSDILIIGNAPSVLKRNLGDKIEKFPVVARFNQLGGVEGYEKHVGTKCDIWLSNYLFKVHYGYDYFKGREVYLTTARYIDQRYIQMQKEIPHAKKLPDWSLIETREVLGYRYPSTGAYCAYYFSKVYNQVYIYGFDFFESEKNHYFNSLKMKHHKISLEKKFFKKMIDSGKVIPFDNYLEDNPYFNGSE